MYRLNDFVRDFVFNRWEALYLVCRGSRSIARQQWMIAPSIIQFTPGKCLGNRFMNSHVPRQWPITSGEITNRAKKLSTTFMSRFFHGGGMWGEKTLKLWYSTWLSNGPSLALDIFLAYSIIRLVSKQAPIENDSKLRSLLVSTVKKNFTDHDYSKHVHRWNQTLLKSDEGKKLESARFSHWKKFSDSIIAPNADCR